jgi:LysR family glycine cleavage system transcriptional activator
MASKRPPLKTLTAFEAATRLLSFKRAGDELHLTPSAISYQIKSLETYLQVRLFNRTRRGLVLTPAGNRYFQKINESLKKIDDATYEIMRIEPHDLITIQTPPSISDKWLLTRLSQFIKANPRVDVRVVATDRIPDFREGSTDVAIWYGENWPPHVVKPFLAECVQPLCSPQLLTGEHPLRTPPDLGFHTLIHGEGNIVTWQDWLKIKEIEGVDAQRGLRLSPSYVAIDAAIKGLGVVLESDILTGEELASGKLIAPFDGMCLTNTSYFLVYPSSHANREAIRMFEDWIFKIIPSANLPPPPPTR